MAAAYGIHFGATSACIAACRDGKTDVIANDAGDRTTPAVVAFTEYDQAVGLAAKQGILRNASNTVCHVKQLLGRGLEEEAVQAAISAEPSKVKEKGSKVVYQVEYKEKETTFNPTQIATIIYKKMMETADSHGGQSDAHDAVITVPIDFTQQQRLTLCEAAEAAGFNALRVLNEPSAAILAYDVGQANPQQEWNVLVYRMGGTSQDVTVVHVSNGMYRVLASATNPEIGGNLMDEIVVNYFAAEFQRKWKYDCKENKRSVGKLRLAAEQCKHILSTMDAAQCSVDSLFEGIDFQCNLSRGRFEGLCGPFIQNCLQALPEALKRAALTKSDIHKVIICGGTGKIPLLQRHLQDFFPDAEVLCSIAPDEVIAMGAAKQCSLLVDSEEDELLRNEQETSLPCLSADISIALGDGSYQTVLSECTPIPVRRQLKFTLPSGQTSFCLHVLQGPQTEPGSLAKVVMKDLPGGSEITAVFHVKSDGFLHVTCSEASSNQQQTVTVESS